MKKEVIILILLFIILFQVSFLRTQNNQSVITGDAVTGEATNANVAVTISIQGEGPIINIIKPENKTYIDNQSLQLNFTSSNTNEIWYNLNSGSNTTITGNTSLSATEGTHTIYLYANNTDGNETSTNVTFTVNRTIFSVIYNNYRGSTKGSSTNFNESAYEDLQNLSDIVLENTNYGKINFIESLNLTNITGNEVDLDSHTNISSNKIELNSTALPNFNKSATLYLYNLSFSNPRILRDNSVCPSTICTEQSYSGGTLVFNVTQFTIYSAEETPTTTPTTTTPSGSGGGGVAVTRDFSISKETLSISLKQGETKKDYFIIKNTGNTALSFSLTSQKIDEFLRINEPSFSLGAGESKTVTLDFLAREDTILDLYLGKLLIKGDGITKEILVAIEVESKKPLFDVKVEIPTRFRYVMSGEELYAEVQLFNVGKIKRADVLVEYFIKDEDGNTIVSESETVFVETQTTFTKSFKIPEYVKDGKYIFYVKTTFDEEVASSTAWFNVGRVAFFNLKTILVIAGAILGIIILIRIFYKLGKIKIKSQRLKKKKSKKKKGKSLEEYKRKIREKLGR